MFRGLHAEFQLCLPTLASIHVYVCRQEGQALSPLMVYFLLFIYLGFFPPHFLPKKFDHSQQHLGKLGPGEGRQLFPCGLSCGHLSNAFIPGSVSETVRTD